MKRDIKPLAFYSIVQVIQSDGVPEECLGKKGVVLGKAQDKGQWSYTVRLQDLDENYYLGHSVLRHTGEVLKREDFYSGETIRVLVDGQGNGTVAKKSIN